MKRIIAWIATMLLMGVMMYLTGAVVALIIVLPLSWIGINIWQHFHLIALLYLIVADVTLDFSLFEEVMDEVREEWEQKNE